MEPILGTEAIASGALTRGQLRWNYTARHPNVYVPNGQAPTLVGETLAAWLWSGRKGIVAGRAAAGLLGVYSMADSNPIELISSKARRRQGIVVREERVDDDEVRFFGQTTMKMTTVARTALDLGRHLPRDVAVRYLDELARATGLSYPDVAELLDRYRGTRGIPQARAALELMDGGSRSPDETRLRLILVDAGLPRPRTSIDVGKGSDYAVIPMGWDRFKVGVGVFDGGSREGCVAVQATQRQDALQRWGWMEVLVADLNQRQSIRRRVRDALRQRGMRV